MHIHTAYSRCLELYREGGINEVIRGVRDYVKYDFGRHYQDDRTDVGDRWEFIADHLSESDRTLIDIGCAEGEFVARSAKRGLEATGYDRNVARLETARTKHRDVEGANFERAELDPAQIQALPEADVVLFLTVHHHWVDAYGLDAAIGMFQTLMGKADTLVYEPPGHIDILQMDDDAVLDPAESVEHYTRWLESEFGEHLDIVDTFLTEYRTSSDRSDPVFILDTSGS